MSGRGILCNFLLFTGLAWGAFAQTAVNFDLNPIPFLKLDDLEESVREQIETSQELLIQAQSDPNVDRASLAQIYGQVGRIYHSYDFNRAAEAAYRNARILSPTSYQWHHYLGVLYQKMGETHSAELSFEMALALDPSDSAARIWRGNLHLDSNRPEEAEKDFMKAIEQGPESAAAVSGLGRVALAQRDYRKVLEHFKRALQLAPAADSMHYLIGQTYRELGDLGSAKAHLEKSGSTAVRIPDPLMDILNNLVQGEVVHLLRGRQAFASGDFAAAREIFQKAVDAAPTSSRARINLSAALSKLNLTQEARAQLEEVLRLEPGNYTAMFNLGTIAFHLQDNEAAVGNLQPFVDAFPDDVVAVTTLAFALLRLERREEALTYFTAANQMAPQDEQIRVQLALLLVSRQELTQVLDLLRNATVEFPAQTETTFLLAQILAISPQLELRDGQEAYRLALRIYQQGKQPGQAELVALALAEMGRCDSAFRWQQTAIALAERQTGDPKLAERLRARLPFYQNSRPCRPGQSPG